MDDGPHGALFLVLGYLKLPDLLSFQRVCRSFAVAINADGLLWRRIYVKPPLSSKLTNEALIRITSKAEGKVEFLGLFDCQRITDNGLLQVVRANLGITKVCLPGCTSLTADGVVRAVKWLTDHNGHIQCLQIHGVGNTRKDHLEILRSLVCIRNQQQILKQSFFGNWHSPELNKEDDRPIDVDICPKCSNISLVFDCTRENCRTMKARWTECRGCLSCIARCEDCGGCVDSEYHGEVTVCSHLLCLECWLRLPKCDLCNRPYCYGHEKESFANHSTSSGFVCDQCEEDYQMSPNDVN